MHNIHWVASFCKDLFIQVLLFVLAPSLGQKILPCGCLFRKNDPYDNASVITKIEVAFETPFSCSAPCL